MAYVDPVPGETKVKWDPYVNQRIWIDYDGLSVPKPWEFKHLLPKEREKMPTGEYGTICAVVIKRVFPNDRCLITVKLESGRTCENIDVTGKDPASCLKNPPLTVSEPGN
jgi:hypothetical protein